MASLGHRCQRFHHKEINNVLMHVTLNPHDQFYMYKSTCQSVCPKTDVTQAGWNFFGTILAVSGTWLHVINDISYK